MFRMSLRGALTRQCPLELPLHFFRSPYSLTIRNDLYLLRHNLRGAPGSELLSFCIPPFRAAGRGYSTIARNSSSVITGTPRARALSSFDPAFSPATR